MLVEFETESYGRYGPNYTKFWAFWQKTKQNKTKTDFKKLFLTKRWHHLEDVSVGETIL